MESLNGLDSELAELRRSAEDGVRLLRDQLRIGLDSYEQDAAYRLFQAREADLRAGDRRQAMLDAESGQPQKLWEGFLGAFVLVLLGNLIENLPLEWVNWVPGGRFTGSALVFLLACSYLTYLLWSYSRKESAICTLRRTLEEARELYADHSELKVRVQSARHERVKEDMLLRSLAENDRGPLDPAASRERRHHLDAVARIDRQMLQDEDEYERNGGDFWLEVLRASLSFRLPGFICSYITHARAGMPITRWQTHARGLIKAVGRIRRPEGYDDRLCRGLAHPGRAACMTRAIDGLSGYDLFGFGKLIEVCQQELGYTNLGVDYPSVAQFEEMTRERSNTRSV